MGRGLVKREMRQGTFVERRWKRVGREGMSVCDERRGTREGQSPGKEMGG